MFSCWESKLTFRQAQPIYWSLSKFSYRDHLSLCLLAHLICRSESKFSFYSAYIYTLHSATESFSPVGTHISIPHSWTKLLITFTIKLGLQENPENKFVRVLGTKLLIRYVHLLSRYFFRNVNSPGTSLQLTQFQTDKLFFNVSGHQRHIGTAQETSDLVLPRPRLEVSELRAVSQNKNFNYVLVMHNVISHLLNRATRQRELVKGYQKLLILVPA